MKTNIFSLLLFVLTIFGTSNLKAQQKDNTDKNNYIVITRKVPQLQPIILTAESLKAEDGDAFGDFQVVICGQEIGDITHPDKINSFIERAEKAGVQIKACGFSLKKFDVDKTKVPEKIKIVENGILYNFQLQKKGYKSISL
jgi:intracellular sulfur oxidation DsrE/DsrF family protein